MKSLVFECPLPIQTTAATISISKDDHLDADSHENHGDDYDRYDHVGDDHDVGGVVGGAPAGDFLDFKG